MFALTTQWLVPSSRRTAGVVVVGWADAWRHHSTTTKLAFLSSAPSCWPARRRRQASIDDLTTCRDIRPNHPRRWYSTSCIRTRSSISSSSNNDQNVVDETEPTPEQEAQPPQPQPQPPLSYGLPVGAVDLPTPAISPLVELLKETLLVDEGHKPPYFRGIELVSNRNDNGKDDNNHNINNNTVTYKRIHLAVPVVDALLDPHHKHYDRLWQFLRQHQGTFLPGTRMTTAARTRHCDQKMVHHVYDHENENARIATSNDGNDDKPKFTFVELFAGIGGFRLGLEPLGGKCVLACESNPAASRMYHRHFFHNKTVVKTPGNDNNNNNLQSNATTTTAQEQPTLPEQTKMRETEPDEVFVQGDVLDLVRSDFPNNGTFDILTAGFPCQPFSARGEQKGLDDKNQTQFRGQLYQELVRLLRELQPPYFLFENVVGLVKMQGGWAAYQDDQGRRGHFYRPGRVMQQIVQDFAACGYKVEWRVIHAQYYVPQYRDRVYFVGRRLDVECDDMNWDNVVDYSSTDNNNQPPPPLRHVLEQDYASCPDVAEAQLTPLQWQKCQEIYNGQATTIAKLRLDDYAPTIISSYRVPSSNTSRFVIEEADGTPRLGEDGLLPRFLTPREVARIMGFPHDFDVSSTGNKPSDIQLGHLYKCLGNAVVPPVIEAIAREMLQLNKHGTILPKR